MNLADFLAPGDIHLDLTAATRADLIRELVARLGLAEEDRASIQRILLHREETGSTGIGRGIAVPHCRTPLVKRLRVCYGRRPGGIEWAAVDGAPVEHVFLLIAPPVEASNDYLPVLGRVARLAREPEVAERLRRVDSVPAFLAVLADQKV